MTIWMLEDRQPHRVPKLQRPPARRKNRTDFRESTFLERLGTALLNRIAGFPAPALFLGFPPYRGIHNLRLQGLDHEDGRPFLADEHTPDLKRIEWNVDQDEFGLRRCRMPGFFATAENHQHMMAVLRIGTKSGRNFWIAEAEI